MPSSISISGSCLAYEFSNGNTLFEGLSFSFNSHIYGLVGPNGVGKSTFLKLLTRELFPSHGNTVVNGTLAVLPQIPYGMGLEEVNRKTVVEILGIQATIAALEQVEAGKISEETLDLINQDWDLADRVRNIFDSLGIGYLTLDCPVHRLSGGELVKVHLAKIILLSPSIVLLDEPTNNLDREGRGALYEFIKTWKKCMIVVSHDRNLLSQVENIVELSNQGLQFYGGNYDFYTREREKESHSLEQKLQTARQEQKKQKRELQNSLERQQRRMEQGQKHAREGGIPKVMAGNLKRKAQSTLTKLKDVQENRLSNVQSEVKALRDQIKERNQIHINIPEVALPLRKEILELREFNFRYPNSEEFLFVEPITYTLVGPKRIQIVGSNGAGKSTLAKLLIQSIKMGADKVLGEIRGTIQLKTDRVSYLDQKSEILGENTQTLLGSFSDLTPHLSETERRTRLKRFLFDQEAISKQIWTLSGGEQMRAALACVLFSETPPELLILDEPTNNLDLDSIERIESALTHFGGAIVVISHDLKFLENIGATERLTLKRRI